MILCVRRIFFYFANYKRVFLHLSIFIPLGKNGKSLCELCNFLGYLTSTSRIYPLLLFSL